MSPTAHKEHFFFEKCLVLCNIAKKKGFIMTRYSKKAQDKIGKVMREFKEGKLKTSAGKKVTDRDQAIAIGISEARDSGYKVPQQKEEKSSKKSKKEKK
ncbi:DUF6496 domain-containing protein [Petrimonas sulfuriphila]|uniref:DUF6496 domain-containing protein n=1 Tax=Petrimonas sulfuriphila TaxID=285070 RepID=UPI003EB8DCD1